MHLPGFAAEASIYVAAGTYRAAKLGTSSSNRIVPAIPACQNCDFICDVCIRRRLACGACGFCVLGICDPNSPL
jgi:hypothetical protein